MIVGNSGHSFAHKLGLYLQEVDYRVAVESEDRDEIYQLRHDAYVREGAIDPNPRMQFRDDYDDFDNCWIFGAYIGNQLVSSIRLHVISPEYRKGPALDVFPDIVGPMIDRGMTLIDPTRFVADEEASKEYPELPYLMLRVACMATEYFEADYCLATVRAEHRAFYRRVFQSDIMCEPRPYPSLKKPICLMRATPDKIRVNMYKRYPVFQSSLTERRMLFAENQRYFRGQIGGVKTDHAVPEIPPFIIGS